MSGLLIALTDPRKLNLLFASVVLVSALAVWWFFPPQNLRKHIFLQRAFEFWILKWMLFVISWGLLTGASDPRAVLTFTDAGSVVTLGLTVALWMADAYEERSTVVNSVFLFGLLFAWNFVTWSLGFKGLAWVFPSMTVAFISIMGLGYVVLKRFANAAIPFLILSFGYVVLQIPSYEAIFIGDQTNSYFIQWLAFAKLFYGGLFYTIVVSTVADLGPIQPPSLPANWGWLKTAVTSEIGVAVIGGLIVEGIRELVSLIPHHH